MRLVSGSLFQHVFLEKDKKTVRSFTSSLSKNEAAAKRLLQDTKSSKNPLAKAFHEEVKVFINETTALKKNNEALDIYEKDDTGKQASIAYYGLHIKAVKKANKKLLLLTRQSKILG